MEKMTNVISDDAFAYFVAEEVKNKLSPAQRNTLLQRENWDRWQRALVALTENLKDQIQQIAGAEAEDERRFEGIGSKRMQKEIRGAYADRRLRVERFLFHVNKRLDEVTKMIETGVAPEANPWEVIDFFKRAIFEHRKLMDEHDLEPTPIDEALWAALSDKWLFDKIDTSLL
jgi:hypothetical protein